MRFLIVGAGAVGGYFAARLHEAGHEVHVVARGEHGAALASEGLHLEGLATPRTVGPLRVTSLADAAGLEAEVALVAVKHEGLAETAAGMGAALAPEGYAASLLNGLDSEGVLAEALGHDRVVAAVAYMSAARTRPGVVEVLGMPSAGLAPLGDAPDPRVDALAEVLSGAGISAVRHARALTMLWQKMLWNAPFNAACALADRDVEAVLADTELAWVVRAGMQETFAVAQAEGAELPDAAVDATFAITRAQFLHTVPSMLQDVRAGRATEVAILQDAVVQRGLSRGIPTPVLRTLAALVRTRHPA